MPSGKPRPHRGAVTEWERAEPAIYAVCQELDIQPLELLLADRHHPLPLARQLVAWLLCHWEHWTVRQTADLLDREWSTVAYYIRTVNRRRQHETEMAARCERLTRLTLRV